MLFVHNVQIPYDTEGDWGNTCRRLYRTLSVEQAEKFYLRHIPDIWLHVWGHHKYELVAGMVAADRLRAAVKLRRIGSS